MADISNVLGKKKKTPLPAGWVERFTKKHPDKPYYFNEHTGESRWTPPVDEIDKAMEKQKSRKRKLTEGEGETNDDQSADAKNKNDTPAMRLYREKLAKRKAEQEAKKSTPKSKAQLNRTVTPQKSNLNNSTSTPSVQRRLRRSSVVPLKDNDSASSDGSAISNASMGAKIKQLVKATKPVTRTPNKETLKSPQAINQLPKIPKVKLARAQPPPSSSSVSDYGTMSDACTDNVSMNIDKSNFGTPKRRSSNCAANERLQKLRKSIGSEKDSTTKRARLSESIDHNDNAIQSFDESKLLNSPLLVSRKKAQSRLNLLEKRVQQKSFLELNKNRQVKVDEGETVEDRRLFNKYETAEPFCEEMDWEPIEDEKITSEVYSVRYQLCEKPVDKLSELSCDVINSGHVPQETNALYVVIDTNVFLSNLPFIEEVRDSKSEKYGRPFIVIPWTVIQEIDYIKDDRDNSRSHSLKLSARKASAFLHKHFSPKHPRFIGQTPEDVAMNRERFMIECPDDEILQTCLQVKDPKRFTVLLSYDKNLCTKAMIHDIPTIGRDDPLEKIYFLKAADSSDFLSNSLHAHIEEKAEDVSISQKELLEADDIVEEAKAVMKTVLSAAVEKEMRSLFGNRWEMHVIIPPPWSILTVLKCALKHWMAAVSDSFLRKTEYMLRDFLELVKNAPYGGRKMADAQSFVRVCNDIVQTIDSVKYPELKQEAMKKIQNLNQRCSDIMNELNNDRLRLTVGTEPDLEEQERRAFSAFKVLEDLYNYSRDICGIASDALGLQCSMQYNKLHRYITPQIALNQQQDVAINVKKLAATLEIALEGLNEGIQPNHQIVHALYEIMINFSSELNFNELTVLTPLDLFCCLKHRKQQIEKGIEQLNDLLVHFGRMANHLCTK